MFRRVRGIIPFLRPREEDPDPIVRGVQILPQPPVRQPMQIQSVRLSIPPIVELRKTQLEYHIINFNKIMSFYKYLQDLTYQVDSFIVKKYNGNSKQQLLRILPSFYETHPNFFTLYDRQIDTLLEIKVDINLLIRLKYETGDFRVGAMDENRIINRIEQLCIETNPNWQQKYNALFDDFDNKKSIITRLFSDLTTNLDKKIGDKYARPLVMELIHTKTHIDALFMTYINYLFLVPSKQRDFDFKLFEETLLHIINSELYFSSSDDLDLPSYEEAIKMTSRPIQVPPILSVTPDLFPRASLSSAGPSEVLYTGPSEAPRIDEDPSMPLVTMNPPTGSSSGHSILTHNGPHPRLAPSDLHRNVKAEDPHFGGIKMSRSKRSSYLKTFNVYSKRKLKTVRKRRNIKKTKRNKHYTNT